MQEALDQESRDSHQRPDPQHQPGEVHGPPADSSELLYRCVTANQVSQLQQLLRDGASADTFYDDDANISSKSILHIACGKGHADCIRYQVLFLPDVCVHCVCVCVCVCEHVFACVPLCVCV